MVFKSRLAPTIENHHAQLLSELEPLVGELMAAHDAKRPLWFPSEVLEPCLEPETLGQIRERLQDLPNPPRVAVAVNLITEEGLPHFHRMIAAHVGEHGVWQEWNNLWTAEEERHGSVLQGY